jgi:hypothetical protein
MHISPGKYLMLLGIAICSSVTEGFSQHDSIASHPTVTTLKKITIGLDSGLEWEQKISSKSTLTLFAGIGVGFASSEVSANAFKTNIIAGPTSYIAYKYYYNLQRRSNNKKTTGNNAGNFFILHAEVYFPVENQNYTNLLFSQGWGIQRPISKRINFELQLGITEHVFYDDPARGPYVRIHPLTNVMSISFLL